MKVARHKLSIVDRRAKTPDKGYWLGRSASERLRAVERCRQIAFGMEKTGQSLQKVLEVSERS